MPERKRPIFLHLLKIHLPVTGWVSIVHRITGVLLFLLLPVPLYLLQRSLESPEGFQQVQVWLGLWPVRLLLLLMLWWFAHHLFAGIRFLLIDLDRGVRITTARRSALLLFALDFALLLGGVWLI